MATGIEIYNSQPNALHESYYAPHKFWYRALRVVEPASSIDHVVWLEHPQHPIGETTYSRDVGLLWQKADFFKLPPKVQDWLKQSKYMKILLADAKCVCDSFALFHAGCQCGHLKLLKEMKKA